MNNNSERLYGHAAATRELLTDLDEYIGALRAAAKYGQRYDAFEVKERVQEISNKFKNTVDYLRYF